MRDYSEGTSLLSVNLCERQERGSALILSQGLFQTGRRFELKGLRPNVLEKEQPLIIGEQGGV
jgi:hypothetical protein